MLITLLLGFQNIIENPEIFTDVSILLRSRTSQPNIWYFFQ